MFLLFVVVDSLIVNAVYSIHISDSYTSLCLYMKRGPIHSQGNNSYELVNLIGTFYHWPSNVEGKLFLSTT